MNVNTEATQIIAGQLSARRLANANARRERDAAKRANVICAKALSGVAVSNQIGVAEDDFTIDAAGRKVRVSPVTDRDIAVALRGNRVLDSMELLEQLGANIITKLIGNGALRYDANHNKRSNNNLYWITKKAAELYGIPASVVLASGCTVELLDA